MQTTKTPMEPKKDDYLHINHFPLELLSYIFVLCGESPHDEVASKSIQVVAPAVCRHWRKIAIGTPILWTDIFIFEPVPCELTALYLKRAGSTVPLDLEIRIITLGSVQKDSKIEKLQTYTERAHNILESIIKHGGAASRWRSLTILTNVFASYLVLTDFLSKACLSSLEHLDMVFFGPSPEHPDDTKLFLNAYQGKMPPKSMFSKPPPQLRSIQLEGVMSRYLFGDISQPQLGGLTNIDIAF